MFCESAIPKTFINTSYFSLIIDRSAGVQMCVCGVMPDKREVTVAAAAALFIVPLGVCV